MAEASQKVYNKHSDRKFIGMYDMGGTPSYMIRDIDLIRDITIKDFDYFVNHFFSMDKTQDPLLGILNFQLEYSLRSEMKSLNNSKILVSRSYPKVVFI